MEYKDHCKTMIQILRGDTKHSRIPVGLDVGYYAVEATTYNEKQTGKFTLELINKVNKIM